VKQPSAYDGAYNSKQNVQHHAFPAMIHQVAGDESSDQSEHNPNKK
jgi:hypothetical protein